MPRDTDFDDSGADDQPKLNFFQRVRYTMWKPTTRESQRRRAVDVPEELEAAVARRTTRSATSGWWPRRWSRHRVVISADLINHARSLNQSTSVYQTLDLRSVGYGRAHARDGLAAQAALLGIVMALFGLAFSTCATGASVSRSSSEVWLLVRAYRLNTKLKLAGGGSGVLRAPNSKWRTIACFRGVSCHAQQALHRTYEQRKRPAKPER